MSTESDIAEYESIKAHVSRRNRRISAAAREISPIPEVSNPKRKKSCKKDFALFCKTYMKAAFPLEWSRDHLKVISKIESSVLHGGLFAMAMPRGSGKTTLSEASAIWSILYGHHKFVCIIGAEQVHAGEMLESIKYEFEENDLIYADFPEAVYPVWKLERIAKRTAGQTLNGQSTRIAWKNDVLVMPTVEGAPSSGSIVRCVGLLGRVRGMKHKRDEGQVDRPSLVIVDDPQTDESSASPDQCTKRERVIAGAVLNLAGPGRTISGIMPCTVIHPDDVADRVLDTKMHPEWRGERMKLVYQWSESENLWEENTEIYRRELLEERGHEESLEHYTENREAMDRGAIVAWSARKSEGELSAIQHAYNLRARVGEEAFAAEYQNEPIEPGDEGDLLSVEEIASKVRENAGKGRVPVPHEIITCGVDIQKRVLYWSVVSWKDDFTGHVLDYGCYPEQKARYFRYSDIRSTIQRRFRNHGVEGGIHAALSDFIPKMLRKRYERDDGADLQIDRFLIDANWGETRDTIYDFCLQQGSRAITPSHGKWYGAASNPISSYKKKTGDKIGYNWMMPLVKGRREVRHVVFDTNFWKSFVHARLSTPTGDSGALTLFASKKTDHRMFAEQMRSETREIVEAKGSGRVVHEWRLKPNKPDNHFFDCIVLTAVAASMQGCVLKEMQNGKKTSQPKRKPKPSSVDYLGGSGRARPFFLK